MYESDGKEHICTVKEVFFPWSVDEDDDVGNQTRYTVVWDDEYANNNFSKELDYKQLSGQTKKLSSMPVIKLDEELFVI